MAASLPVLSSPSLEQDTRAFYEALSDLLRIYQFRDRDRICCHDISVTQCYALEALVRRGPLGGNELAAELYLDKSTASRVVDALERKGYVVRERQPGDGRAVRLEITAGGRALHDRIVADILAEEKSLLADFDPEVRRALTALLQRLARAAGSRVEAGGGSCCRVPSS
jgi:MarR family transcriptional regulator, 2-MHQ and catechol-resistance regulon repressor